MYTSVRCTQLSISALCGQVVMAFSIVFILLSTAALILNTVPCLLEGPSCNASDAPTTPTTLTLAQPPSPSSASSTSNRSGFISRFNASFNSSLRSSSPRPALQANTTAGHVHDHELEENEHVVFAATEAVCVGMCCRPLSTLLL